MNPLKPKHSQLTILGMPLNERDEINPKAQKFLEEADIIIGESRKVSGRYLKNLKNQSADKVFFLDPFRKENWKRLKEQLKSLNPSKGKAVLFSDTGMPLLFDPGKEILEYCRSLNFKIHCLPGPTSWGNACALSGFPPPFFILGFPPRKKEERQKYLQDLKTHKAHCVLLDTPYRFRLLWEEVTRYLGNKRQAFLAWEIGKPEEYLLWGSLKDIGTQCQKLNLQKGEFVLILQGTGFYS